MAPNHKVNEKRQTRIEDDIAICQLPKDLLAFMMVFLFPFSMLYPVACCLVSNIQVQD